MRGPQRSQLHLQTAHRSQTSSLADDAVAVGVAVPVVLGVLAPVVGAVPGVVGVAAGAELGVEAACRLRRRWGLGASAWGATVTTFPPPSGIAFEVGSFCLGQAERIRTRASRSADVTHRSYFTLTATMRAAYVQR